MAFPPPPNNHIIQAMAASLMGSGMPPQPYHQMTPMGSVCSHPNNHSFN